MFNFLKNYYKIISSVFTQHIQPTRDMSGTEANQSIVIVDSREFNAALPSSLFKGGIRLLPVTLSICDYVLSPDIGVERKSFSDLVTSLASGRLQKQMEQMTRIYRISLLLIEMEGSRHGLFKTTGMATLTTTRLVVLLRSYPTMRLLWSFSDRCSCNV